MNGLKQLEGIYLNGQSKKIDTGKLENILSTLRYVEKDLKESKIDKALIQLQDISEYIYDMLEYDKANKNEFKKYIYSLMKEEQEKGNVEKSRKLYEVYKNIDKFEEEEKKKNTGFINYYQLYFDYINNAC